MPRPNIAKCPNVKMPNCPNAKIPKCKNDKIRKYQHVIWMRHAARLPPPPVFDDRRLVQLIAFCTLQIINLSFGVCVFSLRLNLACFCRYLYVLDVCCQFASCQAMLAICKSYCKNVSEMHQQLCNNPSKIMQNPSKIDQNGAKERSESDLGSKSARGC